MTARLTPTVIKAILSIDEQAWTPIDYFLPGAGVSEIAFTPFATGPRGKLLA